MRQTLSVARESASEVVAATCIEFPIVAEYCKWFPGLAKFISAKKPAPIIAYLTSEPERTCYEWVRGKFDPPSRVLIRLLHSDQGWRVLEYLMRGCKAPWWIEVRQARECAGAYEDRRKAIQGELNLG